MSTLPAGYGDYRDPTDTAAWEHAVEVLTREPRSWTCRECRRGGYVDGGPHAAGAASVDGRLPVLEGKAEVSMDSDGSPVWEFACPSCGAVVLVDEDGTR